MPAAATYTAYPTKAECELLLTGAGISISSTLDSDYFRYAAIDEWEQGTGYVPFLAGASATFKFDPPGPNFRGLIKGGGRKLVLNRPMATVTAVVVNVTNDSAGDTLTENVDYWLLPANHAADLIPISSIEFADVQRGEPNSVRVTGKPGFNESIRAEVWQAIRELTAGRYAEAFKEYWSGQSIEWTEGGDHERKSIELLGKYGQTWLDSARRKMRRYRFMQ